MVSIKFWRGKFSRPATGYECIAHALAFDRGVAKDKVQKRLVEALNRYEKQKEEQENHFFFRNSSEKNTLAVSVGSPG